MRKRIGRHKKKRAPVEDVNQLAHRLVQETTGESNSTSGISAAQISQLMAEMGRKGGKIGGKRRLETLTSAQRSEFALKAARARWSKPAKSP
jgi:hypothetical protein